jgi:predicted SAM-dependent methyltransferase
VGTIRAHLRRSDTLVRVRSATLKAQFLARQRKRRALVRAYLEAHPVRRLHLGAGRNILPGWLNTDVYDDRGDGEIVYLDARKRFPLPAASFDLVYTEHMIEHIPYRDAQACLRECLRVLRPGGCVRVATPSVERLLELYGEQTDLHRRYVRWSLETFVEDADALLPGFVLNNFFRNWGHEFVYDRDTLRHALETAGFTDVREWNVGESDNPELVGLERHGELIPPEFNAFETLVLEARRPG